MRNQCVLVFLLASFLLLFGTTEAMASNILVRQGSRGPAVRQVQTLLIEQGWLTGAADGICGNQTVAAIKSFQKANGLDDDGVCGNGTYSVLSGGQEYLPSSDESDGTVMYVNATAYSADDPGNSAYTASSPSIRASSRSARMSTSRATARPWPKTLAAPSAATASMWPSTQEPRRWPSAARTSRFTYVIKNRKERSFGCALLVYTENVNNTFLA